MIWSMRYSANSVWENSPVSQKYRRQVSSRRRGAQGVRLPAVLREMFFRKENRCPSAYRQRGRKQTMKQEEKVLRSYKELIKSEKRNNKL